MSELKYKVIKNDEQYHQYCDRLEEIVQNGLSDKNELEEYELLYLLIESYDEQFKTSPDMDPIEFIVSLKEDHELSQNALAEIAGVSKSYMSETLNYKKGLSKNVIRRLADHFKIQQSVLNREYELRGEKELELAED